MRLRDVHGKFAHGMNGKIVFFQFSSSIFLGEYVANIEFFDGVGSVFSVFRLDGLL